MSKPKKPGRTMQAAHAAAENSDGREIVKPRELVEVSFPKGASPSAAARRTLAMLIARAAGDAWKAERFTIPKRDLRGRHESNDRLPATMDELSKITVKLETISSRGRAARAYFALFAEIVEESSDGDDSLVEFEFSTRARALFGASDAYARLSRGALLSFDSKYAITLYERGAVLCERRDPTWKGSVDQLRAMLGIESGMYPNWAHFRRYVLDQAKAEIDHLAHFTLTWREKRQGRKVVDVELKFWKKDRAGIEAAAREVEQPRVGRKHRRRGTAERVTAESLRRIETIKASLQRPRDIDDEIPH